MKIKELTDVSNVDTVVSLEAACFDENPWTMEAIKPVIESSFRHLYLITKGNDIIGYIIMQIIGDEGEVERIGIHPTFRGQSIGKYLLLHTLQQQALSRCFLEVSEKNQIAYRLYASSGFCEIGRRRAYYHDGSDAIMMEWKRNADE